VANLGVNVWLFREATAPSVGEIGDLWYDTAAGLWKKLTSTTPYTWTSIEAGGPGGGGYATVQEEGTSLTQRTTLNFVGAQVTAADDAAGARTTVTVDAAPAAHTHAHTDLTGVSADQHHAQAHAVAGADHTAAGLSVGQVLRASGATTFAWAAITDADLPSTIARDAEVTTAVSDHAALADPHTGYQKESEKGAASGYADLDTTTKVPTAEMGTGTANAGNFLRGDRSWAAPTATVAISTVNVPFTDGDTARRVTVTDAAVGATDKIICSVRRPDSADDSADAGYVYLANVVRIAAGAFDVLLACLDLSGGDPTERPPNETVVLEYQRAA
jgi:hypothetical protein